MGHAAVIEALHTEGGAALDAADANGWQPLHNTALMQQLDAVRALLRLGAPANATYSMSLPVEMARGQWA